MKQLCGPHEMAGFVGWICRPDLARGPYFGDPGIDEWAFVIQIQIRSNNLIS